jgi:hypothetical protein
LFLLNKAVNAKEFKHHLGGGRIMEDCFEPAGLTRFLSLYGKIPKSPVCISSIPDLINQVLLSPFNNILTVKN